MLYAPGGDRMVSKIWTIINEVNFINPITCIRRPVAKTHGWNLDGIKANIIGAMYG